MQMPMYDPALVQPMREELTSIGVQELLTPEQVDQTLQQEGTTLVFVNSVCGCAAGGVRPGIAMALQNEAKPDRAITVFAGADIDATDTAREFFKGYAPSSPAIALIKDGELVQMFERRDLEGRYPQQIAQELVSAFNQHCTTANAANN